MTRLLKDLPTFIYGTTRLGDRSVPRQQRLEVARAAVDRGLWMHTSRQYDEALEVLGETFADANASDAKARTPLIVKVGGGTAEDVRTTIAENLEPLGVEAIAIGQLSPVDGLENDLVAGGAALSRLKDLKEEALSAASCSRSFPGHPPVRSRRSEAVIWTI